MTAPSAEVVSLPASKHASAPRFRRLLAWFTDIAATVAISQVVLAVCGLALPPDRPAALMPSLIAGLVIGFLYLGFAGPWLGNTLGKWLLGIQASAANGERVPWWRWLLRLLLVGLWPINAVMVLVTASRRHLGDRAAGTVVVMTTPARSFWLGALGAALAFALCMKVGGMGLRVAIASSEAWQVAKAQIARDQPGAQIAALPEGFQILNEQAVFDARLENGYRRVNLQWKEGHWQPLSSAPVTEPLSGESIHFGGAHSSSSH